MGPREGDFVQNKRWTPHQEYAKKRHHTVCWNVSETPLSLSLLDGQGLKEAKSAQFFQFSADLPLHNHQNFQIMSQF